ncbi:hypothetical protein EMCRGX_G010106 [Ephydatia muelleri]
MAVRAERLASVDQDVESDADDENPGPSTSKKQKMSAKSVGAAKYRTKFQKEWLKVYPFVQEVKDNPHKFLCNICMRQVACDHQGKHDIERHMEKAMHQANVKQMKGQTTLGFQVESSPINEQVIRAEVKVAHMLAQHNVPLSLADELTPLFHDIFPDSDIAKNFSSRRTKTACILNGAIAPVLQQNLVNTMKTCPFTLAIDGSTDTGVEKMNPLTVRIFNAEYAMNYALKNLPINDPMLINATFVNYDTKDDATFSQVEYFVQRFGELLPFTPARELELLQEEFTDYQLLMHDAIPSDVWNKAVTDEDEHTTYHRMDIVWHHLSSLKAPDGNPRFNRLSKIAKVVLVIPHSNAQEERIFSMGYLTPSITSSPALEGIPLGISVNIKASVSFATPKPNEVVSRQGGQLTKAKDTLMRTFGSSWKEAWQRITLDHGKSFWKPKKTPLSGNGADAGCTSIAENPRHEAIDSEEEDHRNEDIEDDVPEEESMLEEAKAMEPTRWSANWAMKS